MPLQDFGHRQRIIRFGGRRLIVRPPSVHFMVQLLADMGAEMWAVAQIAKKGEAIDPETYAKALSIDPKAGPVLARAARILGDHHGDETLELLLVDPAAREAVALAVLSVCDVRRIAASLPFDAVTEGRGDDGPEPQDIALLMLAERFGVSPLEIMDWPYEAFLTALEVGTHQYAREVEAQQMGATELAGLPGIGYQGR